jgi:hypothetical protein
MRKRHVVVLFQHRLFGEAIARALAVHSQVEVTTLALSAVSPERLMEIAADAIVLEDQPTLDDVKACLLDAAPALTIVVGPEANTAEVYERHEVIQATAAEIIARVIGDPAHRTRRHAPQARSPSQAKLGGHE